MEAQANQSIKFLIVPEDYLPTYIKDTKDIYTNRHILKELILNDYVLNYLLLILLKAVDESVRFRTLDCLKVIRAILRNNVLSRQLSSETINRLFQIFKAFVFHKNKDVQACANLLIRFQILDDSSVGWLVSNWDKSEHILNRLLRYPEKHPLISKWAADVYRQGLLKNWRSEIIALLIDDNIPPYVNDDDKTIVWAIYYSRAPEEVKKSLLLDKFSENNLGVLWEVVLRLRYAEVVQFIRAKIRRQ